MFQSAPLTEARGDILSPSLLTPSPMFQSAPLTEARGDFPCPRAMPVMASFNPLPLPKQGETPQVKPMCSTDKVSIRSPYRSKGRPRKEPGEPGRVPFQSAPLTEARGDVVSDKVNEVMVTFQSAPLTEARGDLAVRKPGGMFCSFNPLPLPKQGETMVPDSSTWYEIVSIRSPYRSKGRHRSSIHCALPLSFQSAPLTEARGDFIPVHVTIINICFNPLPLPKQGETCSLIGNDGNGLSFNPLPLPKQGETRSQKLVASGPLCFNPLPLPKQGETSKFK